MEIHCKNCRRLYDYSADPSCPNCGMTNTPFRSAGGLRKMNHVVQGDHGWSAFMMEREERLAATKQPSFFRRILPYLQIIIVVFAVGLVGTLLTNYADHMERLEEISELPVDPNVAKPSIRELADASFHLRFPPAQGVQLTVTDTGRIPSEKLAGQLREGEMCVFVNLVATVDDRAALKGYITPPYVYYNEQAIRATDLRGTADLRNYTPIDYTLLGEEFQVSGQLFFILPEDAQEFSLRVFGGEGVEQEGKLHL